MSGGAINELGNAWDGARGAQRQLWLRYVASTNRVVRPDRRCVYAIVKRTAEEVVFRQPVRIWHRVLASVGACQKEGARAAGWDQEVAHLHESDRTSKYRMASEPLYYQNLSGLKPTLEQRLIGVCSHGLRAESRSIRE